MRGSPIKSTIYGQAGKDQSMEPMRLKACELAEWRAETLARCGLARAGKHGLTETSCARLLVGLLPSRAAPHRRVGWVHAPRPVRRLINAPGAVKGKPSIGLGVRRWSPLNREPHQVESASLPSGLLRSSTQSSEHQPPSPGGRGVKEVSSWTSFSLGASGLENR